NTRDAIQEPRARQPVARRPEPGGAERSVGRLTADRASRRARITAPSRRIRQVPGGHGPSSGSSFKICDVPEPIRKVSGSPTGEGVIIPFFFLPHPLKG